MTRDEHIFYWKETAEKDYQTMKHLFQSGDYNWALFIGHLVIEKLLKALYVKLKDTDTPRIHNLSRICELCGIEINSEIEDSLDLISTFNINARYPDYKQEFYKKCDKSFAHESIDKIEGIKEWITELLQAK